MLELSVELEPDPSEIVLPSVGVVGSMVGVVDSMVGVVGSMVVGNSVAKSL